MRYSDALDYIVTGGKARLRDWPPGQFVKMIKPKQPAGELPKKRPFLVMYTPRQDVFPWLPGQAETFSVAWEQIEEEED